MSFFCPLLAGIYVSRWPSVTISRRVVCDDVSIENDGCHGWQRPFVSLSLDAVNGCGDKNPRQCCAFIMFGDSKRGKKQPIRPRWSSSVHIFGEFSTEKPSRWLQEIISVVKVPDCFNKENYSAFLMSETRQHFFCSLGQFVQRKPQIRRSNIVFVLSKRRQWAFLMVDVQFYKTCDFHSDLAEQHRRCIRPALICSVLSFQVAGQIFNSTWIKQ